VDTAPARRSIVAAVADAAGATRPASPGRESDRTIGTVVHRLLERLGFGADPAFARARVAQLLRAEELIESDSEFLDAAVAAYEAMSRRDDVRALYASGDTLHEVPFTMLADGAWLRGTIDCLVRDGHGGLTVLEFKTGRPRPEHRAQVELYRRAAEQMFPGSVVDARLVYADSSKEPFQAGEGLTST
jgi:ATP-dependent exoDNAse (exonuclease V) beta subunit